MLYIDRKTWNINYLQQLDAIFCKEMTTLSKKKKIKMRTILLNSTSLRLNLQLGPKAENFIRFNEVQVPSSDKFYPHWSRALVTSLYPSYASNFSSLTLASACFKYYSTCKASACFPWEIRNLGDSGRKTRLNAKKIKILKIRKLWSFPCSNRYLFNLGDTKKVGQNTVPRFSSPMEHLHTLPAKTAIL